MEIELYVSLSPEGLTETRRKEIAEWVLNLKNSLAGTVQRLTITIASTAEAHDVKK